jgi:6-phosphogluconolactonase
MPLRCETLPDAEAAAARGAEVIAEAARAAVEARGRFVLACSGGRGPWRMFERLASHALPWERVHVLQVDERAVPAGDAARSWARLRAALLARVAVPPEQAHPMPVEEPDLDAAARRYGETLVRVSGAPARIDLVHLGLGADGHTASLVPGDPALEVADRDVAATGAYQGHRRLTLTFPALDRAREVLWLVTGSGKGAAVERLRAGDPGIPAGRVRSPRQLLLRAP